MSISKGNRKIGRIPNISLPPVKSCGNCAHCAKKCYALKAYRMYPDVRKSWDENFKKAKNNHMAYFAEILMYCEKKKPDFFRWHVSGDILNQSYLENIKMIAEVCPDTKFLVFTKMVDLSYRNIPENLSIVFSMFPGMKKSRKKFPIAWCQDGTETRIPENALHCPGSCENCMMCWNLKEIKRDVYFNIH